MNLQLWNAQKRLLRDNLYATYHKCNKYTAHGGSRPIFYIFNSSETMPSFSFPNSYSILKNVSDLKLKTVHGGTQRRPELKSQGQGDRSYSKEDILAYSKSDRLKRIQTELAGKALELLEDITELPGNGIAVDIGCGSGMSAGVLRAAGYYVIGVDSNVHMLDVFNTTSTSQDRIQLNIFSRLPFRQNSVAVILGVSSLQWIFVQPDFRKELNVMFSSIYRILEIGASAAIQYYPRNISEVVATVEIAERHFTNGALVVDFPHSHRGKKLFLLLLKT